MQSDPKLKWMQKFNLIQIFNAFKNKFDTKPLNDSKINPKIQSDSKPK